MEINGASERVKTTVYELTGGSCFSQAGSLVPRQPPSSAGSHTLGLSPGPQGKSQQVPSKLHACGEPSSLSAGEE